MAWYSKLIPKFNKKDNTIYGGFEILRAITGGTWSSTKQLEIYEKSLYVFACVSKIAEKVASIDMQLYQILNSKGDTKEILLHPALDLLNKVNPFQTKSEFLRITMINKKLTGDAFWVKIRDTSGKVVELWNLRPDRMEIIKSETEFIKAYKLTKSDGSTVVFHPDDIVHFKYPSPLDNYLGVSPVSSAQARIDTEDYASQYQRDFFLNNARPDALLKTDSTLTKEQTEEIRRSFNKRHQGIGRGSKLAVLEGGLQYEQISISQREMDYIESMKFTRDDILVAFGVPKTVVSITDDVNRANAETAMYVFLSETIQPEMEMLVEKMNEMLIIPDFGENLFLDYTDPTPENREQTLKDYETGIKQNYLLINEVRGKENLPPMDGGWSFYMPLSMVPVGGLTKQEQTKVTQVWLEKKNEEERVSAHRVFKGRGNLRDKFLLMESVLQKIKNRVDKEVKKNVSEIVKQRKESRESILKPLVKGDVKEKYIDWVNKQIDMRGEKLKEELLGITVTEKVQLIGELNKLGDITKFNGRVRRKIGKETGKVVDDFYKVIEPLYAEFLLPFIEEYTRSAGIDALALVQPDKSFVMTEAINKALKKRAKDFGLSVPETTRIKITRAIEEGILEGEGMIQISERITSVYDEFSTYRADLIARTEATAANNEGFIEAYRQSDVATHKEWIATNDDRTRPEHRELDGNIVKIDQTFANGLQYPQEPNCRCVLAPAFEE